METGADSVDDMGVSVVADHRGTMTGRVIARGWAGSMVVVRWADGSVADEYVDELTEVGDVCERRGEVEGVQGPQEGVIAEGAGPLRDLRSGSTAPAQGRNSRRGVPTGTSGPSGGAVPEKAWEER